MTLPKITNKQQEILILIYQFRFLNRVQIQALLNHKDYKTINQWLKDLTEKEYINRIYSDKAGENMKPAIYYLNLNGVKCIKSLGFSPVQIKKLNREKERSESFISKHILIADIWLDLQSKSDNKIKFAAATSSDLTDPDYRYNFLAELGIDLLYAKISGSVKKYYLLEILEPTLPLYLIRKRIKNYFDFYFSNTWEDNTKENFPTVLVICPTLAMLISIKRFTKKILSEYDDTELRIEFATEQQVKASGIISEIWEEIIDPTKKARESQ